MSESTVAIVGSGIVATTFAYLLTQKGYDVTVFEKGPQIPYPHISQFQEKINYLHENPAYNLSPDLKDLTRSGNYESDLNNERIMVVGGSATRWEAITLRLSPNDFKTRSVYGYGDDWPLTYSEIEPYYCRAEALLGVSGTDEDNPFAPPRSKSYPLPPFELSFDDRILSERLLKSGIILHTTPQARTRLAYEERSQCQNFGTCFVCPIGARYSPNYHLQHAVSTGLCKVYTNTSVRRIVMDKFGLAKTLVFRPNDENVDHEHSAKVVVIAAGAIESARLLLLSSDSQYPDGIGNNSGQVGLNLMFHNLWGGNLYFKDILYPGRFGGWTGQTHQFINSSGRGKHGGIKVEFSSRSAFSAIGQNSWNSGTDIVKALEPRIHWRPIMIHAESLATSRKYVKLSKKQDRFGDPFAHAQYELSEFDYETYKFGRSIFDRFVLATDATEANFSDPIQSWSGHHHMGTCRMGKDVKNSVVDKHGKIHGSSNLFVIGGSNFVSSGAVNPTLTMVALAIQAADYIIEQVL